MMRTSRMFHPALFLVVVLGTLLHAQVPAGPNRPAEVPQNYVITPNGYFHPSCVRELGKGDILLGKARAIQHADDTLENFPACQYPQYTGRGEIVTPGAKPPTISHSYIEDATVTTSASFGALAASWVVPPAPISNDGQTVYLFPGMEDFNDVISILQPVLGWNAFSNFPAWSIASWNCCITGTTFHSTPVGVNPSDLLLGVIQSTCAAGVLSCSSWNISTQDETSSSDTTLSDSSSDGQTFNWAFAGALEVYSVAQCSDYPPNGEISFFDLVLYDYNFDEITNPGWSVSITSGLTPQCNYGGGVDSPTEVTLNYGANSAMSGYLDSSDNVHLVFLTTSQHLEALTSSSGSWTAFDLTTATGAPVASAGTPLLMRSTGAWDYIDTNGDVHEIYEFSSTDWSLPDITAQTGAPKAETGSALSGYLDSSGNVHLLYVTTSQHLEALISSSGSWTATDITAATGAPVAAPGTPLLMRSQGAWDYIDTNGDVHEIYDLSSGWSLPDISAFTGAPKAQ